MTLRLRECGRRARRCAVPWQADAKPEAHPDGRLACSGVVDLAQTWRRAWEEEKTPPATPAVGTGVEVPPPAPVDHRALG